MSRQLNIWIARDSDEQLYIHFEKPRKQNMSLLSWWSNSYANVTGTQIDKLYRDLTFEDGPVKLVCKEKWTKLGN